jgi:hypothetical protein
MNTVRKRQIPRVYDKLNNLEQGIQLIEAE